MTEVKSKSPEVGELWSLGGTASMNEFALRPGKVGLWWMQVGRHGGLPQPATPVFGAKAAESTLKTPEKQWLR
ncbi:uncharacterized protein SPSK_08223 [Sporothrix schenckii 1099-18]|uniref:Uncharacterized protein n=1 Tax=Sporothrix schenckii 1099-18 TaxID=1397361 RepID=A0A0F2MFM7_SPOSC|nr:uncharacterized protein SPSK_08223 [Sporothrix schenckii 1099-18]KJR88493.1 hypothetical protein SPSK_08223 [Sporothrix schenckii 1099-18]